jgi:hypothetical protein
MNTSPPEPIALHVTDWDKHYETHKSRILLRLPYVALPNRHDGESYTDLMGEEDAAIIFTAWILILQVASRCPCRGLLVKNDGVPLTARSLAAKTRSHENWFNLAVPKLIQLGWLEWVTFRAVQKKSRNPAPYPAPYPATIYIYKYLDTQSEDATAVPGKAGLRVPAPDSDPPDSAPPPHNGAVQLTPLVQEALQRMRRVVEEAPKLTPRL